MLNETDKSQNRHRSIETKELKGVTDRVELRVKAPSIRKTKGTRFVRGSDKAASIETMRLKDATDHVE